MNTAPNPLFAPDIASLRDFADIHAAIRAGRYSGHTSGFAPGHVQGNVVILPAGLANDFLRFCQRNPKPCPLLAVSEPGDPMLPELGRDIDIRTDVPMYRIWRNGELVEEVSDICSHWQDDMVAFVLGCSFSFEQALLDSAIPLRHIECGANVSMYRTNIATRGAGAFSGPMVVSMRPMTPANAIRAIQVTARMPSVHGAPVHIGDPALIGIEDLSRPEFGDPVEILPGEIPVYWACGVTPQAIVMQSRPEFCITHAPGAMLITELLNAQFASN